MCQTNFRLHYTPVKYISLNESKMVFKGHVKFLHFNPSKPNKFHIKLFMVSEHLTGYISGFLVYTGKACNKLVTKNATKYNTTNTVMGLLQRTKLLDNHQRVFVDNYFNLCKLLEEMLYRDTYGTGKFYKYCTTPPSLFHINQEQVPVFQVQ